jgi:hypothetical protein
MGPALDPIGLLLVLLAVLLGIVVIVLDRLS